LGEVVQHFPGDGVKALFGAPLAHADDPDRAVRTALAAELPVRNKEEPVKVIEVLG
jgi:class 3 adenylate cyclase